MHEVVKMCREDLDEEKSIIADSITNGSCKDYAEYKYLTGKYAALETAKSILSEAAKRFEEE